MTAILLSLILLFSPFSHAKDIPILKTSIDSSFSEDEKNDITFKDLNREEILKYYEFSINT